MSIRNNVFTGNRSGIDINNSGGHTIMDNVIDFNRTGIIFRNTTDNMTVMENFITNNWTVGVLFLDGSGGTNVPVNSALNSAFNNNNISGNWYAQIVDRQTGGALPAPDANPKNFMCNWYGTNNPAVTTANSTEPGYAAQIPVAYRGTATPPGGQPDIAGPGSPNFKYQPYLVNGTDNSAGMGFQPVPNSCSGCPSGNTIQNTNTGLFYCSIQSAIDDPLTLNGHTITIGSGNYNEQVLVYKGVKLLGVGITQPLLNFTGTVTGKRTILDISADGVTVENLHFNVDLSKLKSAIIATAPGIDNITVKNNVIDAYGTPIPSQYGDRNAVSINYGGATNYRVATGGVDNVVYQGNRVNGTLPASFFRAAVAADEVGGLFTGNTAQTINHDVIVRFGSNGPVTVTNNICNGGGIELDDMNGAAGTQTVTGNTFNATFANFSAPGTAVLRLRDNFNNKNT
ncbi:MAG TPA: NosD domain-containing protein, partial [Ferruginibacter sp.]|nr:NosD domain-containing protein [Ferruginibacter sp.]